MTPASILSTLPHTCLSLTHILIYCLPPHCKFHYEGICVRFVHCYTPRPVCSESQETVVASPYFCLYPRPGCPLTPVPSARRPPVERPVGTQRAGAAPPLPAHRPFRSRPLVAGSGHGAPCDVLSSPWFPVRKTRKMAFSVHGMFVARYFSGDWTKKEVLGCRF